MANPVLIFDLLLTSRRARIPWARYLYATAIIAQFALVAWAVIASSNEPLLQTYEAIELYLSAAALQLFVVLLLATPAAMAGALATEKSAGTLPLLLTTDLSAWQIATGKLLARLPRILSFTLLGFPFLCLVGLASGIATVESLARLLAGLAMAAFALASWGLWVSLRSDQARQAAVRLYVTLGVLIAVWAVGMALLPRLNAATAGTKSFAKACVATLNWWLPTLDPLHATDPTNLRPASAPDRFGSFLSVCGALGTLFLGLTVARLRAETVRALERTQGRRLREAKRSPRRAAVHEDDPVAWRERILGGGWKRWAWALVAVMVTGWLCDGILTLKEPWVFILLWAGGALLAAPLVGVRAAGAISSERERQTWDSLLLTPLDTWEILADKRRGVVWSFLPILAAFALPALAAPWFDDWRFGVVSLGLFVLFAAIVHFMASVGIQRSAESRGSWLTPAAAVARGYVYVLGLFVLAAMAAGLAFFCVTLPFFNLIFSAIGLFTLVEDYWWAMATAAALLLAWRLHAKGDLRLWHAQSWIEAEERYGRTLARSLVHALKKHYTRLEAKRKDEELRRAAGLAPLAPDAPRRAEEPRVTSRAKTATP